MKLSVRLTIFCLIITFFPISAQALDSATYKIPQFNLPSFGSTINSTNYGIRATSGPIVGVASSTNFGLDTGFPAVTGSVVSLTLNSTNVNLGDLSPGSPVSNTTTTTVATDSSAGYTLAIQKDHLLQHTNTVNTISDYPNPISTPTTFSGTGFGFSVSSGTGVDPKWNSGTKYAAIPTLTTTTYHSVIQSISAPDNTTINFKVDVPTSQAAGLYSTNVAIFATALP